MIDFANAFFFVQYAVKTAELGSR